MKKYTNIAQYLADVAAEFPDRNAVINPSGRHSNGDVIYSSLTFSELEKLSNKYANALFRSGIVKGMKVSLFIRPGLEFVAAVFAVFKTGAVPVLIDPGMGRKNLLDCIKRTEPEALLAVPEVHWVKLIFRSAFKSIKISIGLGRFLPPGTVNLYRVSKNESDQFDTVETKPDDDAAILFTTGSTGPPKGVLYSHKIFITQTELIKKTYGAGPEETDMPAFPLFALFATAMAMPCTIPDMDPTRPAKVNPERIIEAINNNKVSFSFGSPSLWRTVSTYCNAKGIKFPSLKKVLMAGAPVSAELHQAVKNIMGEGGETMIPYGCTESLPITTFTGSEMISETAELTARGKGYCVGYPLEGINIKIIKAVDTIIEKWDDSLVLPQGEIGEIAVHGNVVTREYHNNKNATDMAKIDNGDGTLWHRMGDTGFFDEKGRLWFCGRKAHRVIVDGMIYYPVCCEAIFNQHPAVFRSALVGVGSEKNRKPVLIIEPEKGKMPNSRIEKEMFIKELKELGSAKDFTKNIEIFLFHPEFPVDIRHNAKIFREKLSIWAKKGV